MAMRGSSFAVAPDAAGKVVGAGLAGPRRRPAFPDDIRWAWTSSAPHAPDEEQDGAEQLPEHLGRAGERGDGQVMRHSAACQCRQPQGRRGGTAAAPARTSGIFRQQSPVRTGPSPTGPRHGGGPQFLGQRCSCGAASWRRKRCLPQHAGCTGAGPRASAASRPRRAAGSGADGVSCRGSFVFSSIKRGCSFLTEDQKSSPKMTHSVLLYTLSAPKQGSSQNLGRPFTDFSLPFHI